MSDQHDQNSETDRRIAQRSVSPVQAGLSMVCPNCGQGKLFDKITTLSLVPTCPKCGFDLKAADPGDGPAVFVIFILGFLITGGALWLEFKVGVPVWVHFLVWPPITIGGAVWLLRILKGWIIAMQFQNDAHEGTLDHDEDAK